VIAFAFTTIWDVPLYASLKAGTRRIQLSGRRSKSFRIVSILATTVAVGLILPALWFTPTIVLMGTAPTTSGSTDGPDVNAIMAVLSALTLSLFVPSLLITCPALPLPARVRRASSGANNFPISKAALTLLVLGGSLVPAPAATALSDACLVLALAGTYLLPALLHIVTHVFKRSLPIIVPRRGEIPSIVPGQEGDDDGERTPLAARDELLQRKERALQRRRTLRRIVWDVGVWTLLLPVGGGGLVWTAGRLFGAW
jgi:hypothetical protein